MSSTAVGDRLEEQVFNLISTEIAEGRFFISPAFARVYRKKGYYSKDRGKEIIFDVSVEGFLPGSETYSVLILFECKNYTHSVPVDDAEEFHSKIQQVSASKGVIVSASAFQQGTQAFSKSKNIGLMRYFGLSSYKWELYRSPSSKFVSRKAEDKNRIYRGMTLEGYVAHTFDLYCCVGELYTNSLASFLSALMRGEELNEKQIERYLTPQSGSEGQVEYLKESDIRSLCEYVLRSIGHAGGLVDLRDICSWQKDVANLDVKLGAAPSDADVAANRLGKITFDPLEITVFAHKEGGEERQRFTLAHELGHLFLGHARYMKGEYCSEEDLELNAISSTDIGRMEWQANYFASCLLLPTRSFFRDCVALASGMGLEDRGFGYIYLDDQLCNQRTYYELTDALKAKYKVSRTVIKRRLEELLLLHDKRKRFHVSETIRGPKLWTDQR